MINIAIVGCGRISKNHFEAIKAIDEFNIVGCCDIVKERAKSAALKYQVPFYTDDYTNLLSLGNIDLISICTPSGLHPKHGEMAANQGINVLTEKPMGVSVSSAKKLITSCKDNEVKLFVVYQNRLNPTIQLAKKALEKGRFGKVYQIVSNVFWTRPQEYYDMDSWRGTWELDGGAFCNQASHYIDLVQWFGGKIHSVAAYTATLGRNIEAEDTGSAIIRFDSGCIASINVTMLTYPKNLEGSLTILGERGTVRIGGVAANEILQWNFSVSDEDDLLINNSKTNPTSVYGFGHLSYYQNVLSCLKGREKPLIDGPEGLKSLQIIESIYKSNSSGTHIYFP